MKSVKINSIMAELKAVVMDFTDFICWLYDKGVEGWNCDLMEIRLVDYVRFYQDADSEDMNMIITDTETIYSKGIGNGIDVYNEENFIGASISENDNDLLLKILDENKKVQSFVISVC